MKVNKELIEKYHLGLCSLEEEEAVQNWLLDDEPDMEPFLLTEEQKQQHKQEMWASISEVLPAQEPETKVIALSDYFTPFVKKSIAASLVFGLLGSGIFWWWHQSIRVHPVALFNHESQGTEEIQTQGLTISLGPKSQVNVNASLYHKRGNIDFCGIILINPDEDIELTLNASCKNPGSNHEKMTFRKGHKYIAVNYNFTSDNELIIVSQQNIINLPPALQKEIIKQFNI